MKTIENLTIKFDNNEQEITESFKLFQRKYMLKRKVLFTIVYGIACGLGINLIVTNMTNPIGYVLTALSLAMIFSTWARPYFVRKRLMHTLQSFSKETYIATFKQDAIEIETEILDDDNMETVAVTSHGVMTVGEGVEIPQEQEVKTEKTVLSLTETTLDSMENDDMFILFVARSYMYAFPKRCMTDDQQNELRTYLDDKNI